MTCTMKPNDFSALVDLFIRDLIRRVPSVREGTVMTEGPAPYRRVDCDGRALAYLRPRPKKKAVRIDVSGLWLPGPASRLSIASAGGSATLMLASEADLREAVDYVAAVVTETRLAVRRREGRRSTNWRLRMVADAPRARVSRVAVEKSSADEPRSDRAPGEEGPSGDGSDEDPTS